MPTLDPRDAVARLVRRFQETRARTERLAAPLSAEDQGLQAMAQASPTKWHRAHTTWFFETFLLAPRGITPVDPRWGAIFNSYYVAVGPRHAQPKRGLLSRPSVAEIDGYRRRVDGRVVELLTTLDEPALREVSPIVELGLAHEEQHQELILTDILAALAANPLCPVYADLPAAPSAVAPSPAALRPLRFVPFDGGLVEVGCAPADTFAFDNELPRHRRWLEPFELGDRLLTVAEWKAFAEAGGYDDAALWLSEGFEWAQEHRIRAPEYGHRDGRSLVVFDLGGEREARDDEPITHLSFYEADALARFLGARLPTEAEWETAASTLPEAALADANFLDSKVPALRAQAVTTRESPGLSQVYGDAWEWTQSSYEPYPGYRAPAGALGEYNGKFMVNQLVLRGGSCFTPPGHVRATYRNFWHPPTRFQKTGVRLARSSIG